jgi:hypothetical protein
VSARGVTAQELPENQDESVKGVVRNEILHGHVRPAAAMEEGELPEAGEAVDAFTASQPVHGGPIPEGFDSTEPTEPTGDEPTEPPVLVADGEETEVVVDGGSDEEDEDAAGAGE